MTEEALPTSFPAAFGRLFWALELPIERGLARWVTAPVRPSGACPLWAAAVIHGGVVSENGK
ncbi:hypothetical protein CKA56_15545 [Arcobacter venerupis]|nr:hypothetical protein CKA56_15545 [Arcobacter venerupis]